MSVIVVDRPMHADAGVISRVRDCLARGEEGGLSREDALFLLQHAGTPALLAAASALRDRVKGRVVSYSRKVFIPLTHLCRDYCGYCTHRRTSTPGRRDGSSRRA